MAVILPAQLLGYLPPVVAELEFAYAAPPFTSWHVGLNVMTPAGLFDGCFTKEQMMDRIITQPPGFLAPFDCVRGLDWRIVPGQDQYGRGDILLANGDDSAFVVLQVQYLDLAAHGGNAPTKRTMKRRKCRESALHYASIWKQMHPNATVHALMITNDAARYLGTRGGL